MSGHGIYNIGKLCGLESRNTRDAHTSGIETPGANEF